MKGLRTVATNILMAMAIPPLMAGLKKVGVELTPEQQVGLVADLITGANLVLRYFTTTPIGVKTMVAVVAAAAESQPIAPVSIPIVEPKETP